MNRHPDFMPLLILFILGIGFFFPVIFMGRSPAISSLRNYEPWRTVRLASGDGSVLRAKGQPPVYTWNSPEAFADDLNRQFIPWGTYCQDRIRHGDWPFWNPHLASGQPMFANHQTGLLNPIVLLCYLVFPGISAFSAIFLISFILAGWGMYAYLRILGLGRWPSLLAAVTYQFLLGYIPTLDVLVLEKALLPFLLYAVERLVRAPAGKGGIWAATSILLLALVQTTCHAQEAVYISYLLGPYIVFIAGDSRSFPRGSAWKNIGKRVLLAIGIYIPALLVGMVQNLPTFEFYEASTRMAGFTQQLTEASDFERNLNWIVSLMIAFPRLYGDYIRDNLPLEHYLLNYGYVGIVTILAALFAGWVGPNRRQVWFWRIACLIFFAALISNWFYLDVLSKLPLFRVSLQPPFSPFFFGLVVLAGHGFKFLLEPKPKRTLGNQIMGYTSVLVFGGLASMVGLYIYTFFLPRTVTSLEQNYVFGQISLGFLFLSLACLVVGLFWRYMNTRKSNGVDFDIERPVKIAALALMVVILLDLWPVKAHFNPFVPKKNLYFPTVTTEFLQDHLEWEPGNPDGPYRFGRSWKEILPPNTGMMYGLDDFGGYDSNLVGRYSELLTKVDPTILQGVHFLETPRYRAGFNSKLWNMLGVKYVLAHPEHLGQFDPPEQWHHVYRGELLIMENSEALPRMHLVNKVYSAPQDGDELELAANLDPAIEAVINTDHRPASEIPNLAADSEISAGNVVITSYKPERVEAEVNCDSPALLCFYDTWFPGWEVTVDGESRQLERVNYTFKGVFVDSGDQEVVFSYRPRSFRIGGLISLAGIIITILLAIPISRFAGNSKP